MADDDFKKAKDKIDSGAKAVGKAAKNLLRIPVDTYIGRKWGETSDDVSALDKEFSKEEKLNDLRKKLEAGDVEVRVMQVTPSGRLKDVSDKVNPKDLNPDDLVGMDIETGTRQPGVYVPRSREEALQLLQEILPGKYSTSNDKIASRVEQMRRLKAQEQQSESMRRMEATLADSDKILEHWKK